ncbi:MAG: hypothetical protein JWO82_2744 [Akkermansiaceae bacterium]|nr:hypothetical protein [Akkermansiaceae bacterium]
MTALTLLRRAGWALATSSPALATPGALDPAFHPGLILKSAPVEAIVTESGNLLFGGAGAPFDRIQGRRIGSRFLTDPDGKLIGEPVPGLLDTGSLLSVSINSPMVSLDPRPSWFPLEEGMWLIPDDEGGWLRLNTATRSASAAFPDLTDGETISPQFLDNGTLWTIRTKADGATLLEKRRSFDGRIDPAFTQGTGWPGKPGQAVSGPDGKLWVLSAGATTPFTLHFDLNLPDQLAFRIQASGAIDTTVAPLTLTPYRHPSLRPAADGGFTVIQGDDERSLYYWPRSWTSSFTIEQYDAARSLLLKKDFSLPFGSTLAWAEDDQRRLLIVSGNGLLKRYLADGSEDSSFHIPDVKVGTLLALPGGKWLINGNERFMPDGQADPTWNHPLTSLPGSVNSFTPLPDGRTLVSGRFSGMGDHVTSSLCLLRPDGSADPGFSADKRLTWISSAAVSGGWIYAIHAGDVRLANGSSSNLVRMDFSGGLDESFMPGISSGLSTHAVIVYATSFSSVCPGFNGGILAVGNQFSDFPTSSLLNIDPAGTRITIFPNEGIPVPVGRGEVVIGRSWYAPDGRLLRRVGGTLPIAPVCEWQGGVLFAEDIDGAPARKRLRLWKGSRWDPKFATPPVAAGISIQARAGDTNSLYISAGWSDETSGLRRMGPTGRFAPTFHIPEFTFTLRRESGPWFTLVNDQIAPFNPSTVESPTSLADFIYRPETRKLWVAGSFNRVSGQDRDGIAALQIGGLLPAAPQTSAWSAWQTGMGLSQDPQGKADPDNDGIPNAMEFILGTDPRSHSQGPELSLTPGNAVFTYTKALEATDYRATAEFSTDLRHWTAATPANSDLQTTPGDGDTTRCEVTIPRLNRSRMYVRLRATVP